MNSLNSILIDGNITADPRVTDISDHTQVTDFSIASDRYFRRAGQDGVEKETSFISVKGYNLDQRIVEKMVKGQRVRVVGRLKQERWKDAEGIPHSRHIIIADHVELGPMPQRVTDEEKAEA